MDGWKYVNGKYVYMCVWTHGCMYGWMDGCMNGGVHGCVRATSVLACKLFSQSIVTVYIMQVCKEMCKDVFVLKVCEMKHCFVVSLLRCLVSSLLLCLVASFPH